SYDAAEDRLLLAINSGKDAEWACWLTRRMTIGVLRQFNVHLDETSPAAIRTPLQYRGELAVMEREAAIATTQAALSTTKTEQLASAATRGELANEVTLTPQPNGKLQLDVTGKNGGHARGLFSRAELRTVLLLIEKEAIKAEWGGPLWPAPERSAASGQVARAEAKR